MRQRAGVSTHGHGQGEGPDGYKFPRSGDAVDVGRGRSERSERSPARWWQSVAVCLSALGPPALALPPLRGGPLPLQARVLTTPKQRRHLLTALHRP